MSYLLPRVCVGVSFSVSERHSRCKTWRHRSLLFINEQKFTRKTRTSWSSQILFIFFLLLFESTEHSAGQTGDRIFVWILIALEKHVWKLSNIGAIKMNIFGFYILEFSKSDFNRTCKTFYSFQWKKIMNEIRLLYWVWEFFPSEWWFWHQNVPAPTLSIDWYCCSRTYNIKRQSTPSKSATHPRQWPAIFLG